jgi:hypothetical protein
VKFVPKLLTVESHLVQNFLAKHQIFQFPDMKMLLKGNRFQDMEEIKQNTTTGCSKESVPKVLCTMEGLLEQVCGV